MIIISCAPQPKALKAYLLKKENLIIVRAIKIYGLENFKLIKLEDFSAAESLSIEQILEREQYWVNLLNPSLIIF